MSAVSGSRTYYSLWDLPETVRRSAQRPLFAILLAGYVSSPRADMGVSVGKLVDWMVRRAVEAVKPQMSTSVEALLRSLAVRLTEDKIAIPLSQVSSSVVAGELLLATRLVNITATGEADFALPVLRQWFAYAALREREVAVESLVGDPARLDRWLDVLTTAVELADEQVDELLEPVVRHNPGVASLIIAEALEDTDAGATDATLTAEQFGREFRNAMSAFVAGLGPPGKAIGPVDERGHLKPLGVRITGRLVPDGLVRGFSYNVRRSGLACVFERPRQGLAGAPFARPQVASGVGMVGRQERAERRTRTAAGGARLPGHQQSARARACMDAGDGCVGSEFAVRIGGERRGAGAHSEW